MEEIYLVLKVLQMVLPDEFFTKNPAFLVPHIIPNYGVLQKYADKSIYNAADNLEQTEKNYISAKESMEPWSSGKKLYYKNDKVNKYKVKASTTTS
eukprot:5340257-Ditylum_brightwellii.AAC.1